MEDMKWSDTERRIARRAYDAALMRNKAALVEEFKRRAAAATDIGQVWEIGDWLREAARDMDRTYDYRYSVLILVFGVLLREGWLRREDLEGLRADKLEALGRLMGWDDAGDAGVKSEG